jgi:hypothetical protein
MLMSKKNVIIRIGDVAISIEGHVSGEIAPAYLPFVAQEKPEISLRLHHGPTDLDPVSRKRYLHSKTFPGNG